MGTRETALQDRIEEAKRLRAKGWLLAQIAEEMGVCLYSVHQYLRAAGVPSRKAAR